MASAKAGQLQLCLADIWTPSKDGGSPQALWWSVPGLHTFPYGLFSPASNLNLPSHNLWPLLPVTPSATIKKSLALSSFQLPFKRLEATITLSFCLLVMPALCCWHQWWDILHKKGHQQHPAGCLWALGTFQLELPVFANKPCSIHASGCL